MHVADSAEVGPVLVSIADFAPEHGTEFALYSAPSAGTHDTDADRLRATMHDRLLLAGESRVMQYTSSNWGWGASSEAPPDLRRETRGYSGEYLLGVYDKRTNQVTLRVVPAFTLSRSVKALASVSAMAAERGTGDALDYTQARRDLGEAFGNKKQKQAARNMDRMKVNTENMDSVLEHVATHIDESTVGLPSEAELEAALNASRALPAADLEASEPAQVYPLPTLVSPAVLKATAAKPLLRSGSQTELARSLHALGQPSPWLLPRLWHAVQCAQNDNSAASRELVRVGYYLALLFAFRRHARSLARGDGDQRQHVAHKMHLSEAESDIVMDELISRFTETARGSERATMTATSETKLLAHILVLALHLDGFSVAPQPLAQELGVPVSRVNDLYKSLGCSPAQSTQHSADGGDVTSRPEKRWRLKLPLSFPSQRRRGPARR
ncbi:DNA-directed RNA polymerase I subunit rpa49 [Malassezia sp. CBS 17886]|nr:DNA-directed RNA polymerase I subunit rpa49 [Malassezia sp. CBS 17886]